MEQEANGGGGRKSKPATCSRRYRDTVTDTRCCLHLPLQTRCPPGASRLSRPQARPGSLPASAPVSAGQARGTKRSSQSAPTHGGGGSGSRHEPDGNTCSARSDVLQLPPVTDFPPLPATLPQEERLPPTPQAPAIPHLSPYSPRRAVATPRARFDHSAGSSRRLPAPPPPPPSHPPSHTSPRNNAGASRQPRLPDGKGRCPPPTASRRDRGHARPERAPPPAPPPHAHTGHRGRGSPPARPGPAPHGQ